MWHLTPGLVDGDNSNECVSSSSFGPGLNPGETITAEFNDLFTIQGMGLYFDDEAEFGSGYIEFLNNSNTFEQIVSVENINIRNQNRQINFPYSVETTAIRFTMTSGGGVDSNLCVKEIEIYGELATDDSPICFDQSDLDAQYQAGRQACIDDPASCRIFVDENTSATLSSGLDMHIPMLQFGAMNLWADFEFAGESDGDLIWKLTNYGQE